MFDISKLSTRTANDFGWYVAHVYPAKNGDTNFKAWSRTEVKRRFFLTLHPCNLFLVPGVKNHQHGENPRLIAFIAEQFAFRYGATYREFLKLVEATQLVMDPAFSSEILELPGIGVPSADPEVQVHISYSATRLTFKRDLIEPLAIDHAFEIKTPMGVFRLTKKQFESEFRNVAESVSYRDYGNYNYSRLPQKALPFKVPE